MNFLRKMNIVVFFLFIPFYSVHAISPGDEVSINKNGQVITVRAKAQLESDKLYFVVAGDKGLVLDGPVKKNGYIWYLIDWDDLTKVRKQGWTALGDNWFSVTGKPLVDKLDVLHEYSKTFFENRPQKISQDLGVPEQILAEYNSHREKGFHSLDLCNKNLSRSVSALQNNNYTQAYQEYKYAVVHLNNTKKFFNLANQVIAVVED